MRERRLHDALQLIMQSRRGKRVTATAFLKHVGERPIRQRIHAADAIEICLRHKRRRLQEVMCIVTRRRAGTPLRQMNFCFWKRLSATIFLMSFRSRDVAPNSRVFFLNSPGVCSSSAQSVGYGWHETKSTGSFSRWQNARKFFTQTGCQSSALMSFALVTTCGSSCLRLAIEATVWHEIARGRAADAELRVNFLQHLRRGFVEFKILALRPRKNGCKFGSFHTSKYQVRTSSMP